MMKGSYLKMILVSVFDKKSDEYAPAFCVANIATAVRSFESTVKRGDNDLSNFPEDFSLVKVGEFINGDVISCDKVVLCNAVDCFPADVKEKLRAKPTCFVE